MTVQDWVDLFKLLGVAAPLVGFLAWQVRENSTERQRITSNYLTALTTVVENNRTAMQANTAAVQDLSSTLREHIAHSEHEHERIMNAIEARHGPHGYGTE